MSDGYEPAPLPASPEWQFLADAQVDQLAGLLLEIAGQLHVERTRVLALEHALVAAGVLEPTAGDVAVGDPELRQRTADQLDHSLSALLRVLTEDDDARTPLRADNRRDHRVEA